MSVVAHDSIADQPLYTWQVQEWKRMADELQELRARQALRFVVDVTLKAHGRVLFYVRNEEIARAVVDSYVAKDPEIDFITADGSWVRFPRKSVAKVEYLTREQYAALM
jgi:hypothetical protein